MKTLLITLTVLSVFGFVEIILTTSASRISAQTRGPFLYKRSLCNTFGGCGAKRSVSFNGIDEFFDDRRTSGMDDYSPQVGQPIASKTMDDALLLDEILDEIVKLLKKERTYQRLNANKLSISTQLKQPTMDDVVDQSTFASKPSAQADGTNNAIQDYQTYRKMSGSI